MDGPFPFMSMFPDVYPTQRRVNPECEPSLVGLLVKSVMYDQQQCSLLCRALAVHGPSRYLGCTVSMRVTDIAVVVGYDLELCSSSSETWERVEAYWEQHMVAEPVLSQVRHDDIKRQVDARVFPLASVALAKRYMETVAGALTFGDFNAEKGYYMARDGNVPALCSGVMFGRLYFLSEAKVEQCLTATVVPPLSPRDLIYDHELSEAEALAFDTKHCRVLYNTACLDIETVFDEKFRDPAVQCPHFAADFPYCTEKKMETLTAFASQLAGKLQGISKRAIPSLPTDMVGKQHEVTCVSLVLLRGDRLKEQGKHRKSLMVFYNKRKVTGPPPKQSSEVSRSVGIDDPNRIQIFTCGSEFALLYQVLMALTSQNIELLYVYNAGFDLRVLEQRVRFYESRCCNQGHRGVSLTKGAQLRALWNSLFVSSKFGSQAQPVFQFDTPRMIEMYEALLKELSTLTGWATAAHAYSEAIQRFNKGKMKLGHFKMNSCGANVIDLFRMAETRSTKFGCPSMKLNDVVQHTVEGVRQAQGMPPKDRSKLYKLSEVSYERMDELITKGGEGLFKVLVYNLVDSQLCARLAKVLDPVKCLFYRCRTTLNLDVIVHGRGDTFGGFVQSIHAVQIPQLKYKLDNLRCVAGPVGRELANRRPWTMNVSEELWQGGSVCKPLTGLHYSGPGMGLELSFDFASMYPSNMSALNISSESTVPWPPKEFDYDLSGWVCYNWEVEGFKYASLILKYDEATRNFVRDDGIMNSSMERYYERRAEYKQRLKDFGLSDEQRAYLELLVLECKLLMNSFYGTAGACGPLVSAAGRQQISVVNGAVSEFFESKCPVVYGDTDSVMVAVGYGPDDEPEPELEDRVDNAPPGAEDERLAAFATRARKAIVRKLARAEAQVPAFLEFVHKKLIHDILDRMYLIGPGNSTQRALRDPKGRETLGYPTYLVRMPDGTEHDITGPFVKNLRIKLEYENSSSVICHEAKKTYVSLSHTVDHNTGELSQVSVKVRGLSAFKSVRSACDTAMADIFISCVMRGDCLKLEPDRVSCFSTLPWHQLSVGDVVLFNQRKVEIDRTTGLWRGLADAETALDRHKVDRVKVLELGAGFLATSVTLRDVNSNNRAEVTTLYKDKLYCLNHLFSSAEAVRRDLIVGRAAELESSRMAIGFFPWRKLLRCAKNTNMKPEVLSRLRVENSSVKTTYIETVDTWLQRITGLSTKISMRPGDNKVKPCEAAFYRYPLDLKAKKGCLVSMFGACSLPRCSDSAACQTRPDTTEEGPRHKRPRLSSLTEDKGEEGYCDLVNYEHGCEVGFREQEGSKHAADRMLIAHPYQPNSKCYEGSRVLVAHEADYSLINDHSKMIAHCVVDYCLPRYMYSLRSTKESLAACRKHLANRFNVVSDRLNLAGKAFLTVMNNCPLNVIPSCGLEELDAIATSRTTVLRLAPEKRDMAARVLTVNMGLNPAEVYRTAIGAFGASLSKALDEGTMKLTADRQPERGSVSVHILRSLLDDARVNIPGTWLSVSGGESDEGELLDLAGTLYQAVLAKQVCDPDTFPLPATKLPVKVLCIMPYSNRDPQPIREWIKAFEQRSWQKEPVPQNQQQAPCGKRPAAKKLVFGRPNYHCMGCLNFFKELNRMNVSVSQLESIVYDKTNKRRFGMCVNESY